MVNLLLSRNAHTRRQANTLLPRSSSTTRKPSNLPFVNTRWWSHLSRKEANPWLNVKELLSYTMHTWSENTSFSSWICKWHFGYSVLFVLFISLFWQFTKKCSFSILLNFVLLSSDFIVWMLVFYCYHTGA